MYKILFSFFVMLLTHPASSALVSVSLAHGPHDEMDKEFKKFHTAFEASTKSKLFTAEGLVVNPHISLTRARVNNKPDDLARFRTVLKAFEQTPEFKAIQNLSYTHPQLMFMYGEGKKCFVYENLAKFKRGAGPNGAFDYEGGELKEDILGALRKADVSQIDKMHIVCAHKPESSEALQKATERLEEMLKDSGFRIEPRKFEYSPHLTLATLMRPEEGTDPSQKIPASFKSDVFTGVVGGLVGALKDAIKAFGGNYPTSPVLDGLQATALTGSGDNKKMTDFYASSLSRG